MFIFFTFCLVSSASGLTEHQEEVRLRIHANDSFHLFPHISFKLDSLENKNRSSYSLQTGSSNTGSCILTDAKAVFQKKDIGIIINFERAVLQTSVNKQSRPVEVPHAVEREKRNNLRQEREKYDRTLPQNTRIQAAYSVAPRAGVANLFCTAG